MNFEIGEFLQITKDTNGYYDCVVTCFFIDTAHNILEYFRRIK